jgi:hypothetical protein
MQGDPDRKVGITVVDDLPYAVEGARITLTSGAAAGRSLYCISATGGLLTGSAIGEAQTQLFNGVEPGDEVYIENRDFLAFCNSYRHQLLSLDANRRQTMDGRPIYPQHPASGAAETSPPIFGGGDNTGAIRRPLFLLQHSHDTSGWPEGGVSYADLVHDQFGEGTDDMFRFWWIENAEHIPASTIAPGEPPVATTRLIDYAGSHDAALDAMVAFVERGVTPQASTSFVFDPVDKGLHLPATADERHGIQPIATVTANGGARADVRVGDRVTFAADVAVPEGAGALVEIAWDFDGTGTWPDVNVREAGETTLHHEAAHLFDHPGTYFAAARVVAHPTGDSKDPHARVENLGRCRVVVRA